MKYFRRVLLSAPALAVVGCSSGQEPTGPAMQFEQLGVATPAVAPVVPLTQLVVPTYDGSGQAVHPDVLWFPTGWRGWEYWMAFTPYPHGMAPYENASIVVSHDGKTWQSPAGLTNPVMPPPRGSAYNSDPDLSYDSAHDRLVLLNREARGRLNIVSVLTSSDGVTWSAPATMFVRKDHGMISPALVLSPGRAPRIWYVDGGVKRCPKRVTRVLRQDGIDGNQLPNSMATVGWSPVRKAGLTQAGYKIWHLDVTWIPARAEYWAVYPAYANSDCGPRDLFFARSPDGLTWTTYPAPLLRHADQQWTSAMLYRASALYDPARDVVRLFLSASAPGPEWRLGYVEFRYADLLSVIQGNTPGTVAMRGPPRSGMVVDEETLP
jgi:hypothetical protein